MARIRTVKSKLFRHEKLFEIEKGINCRCDWHLIEMAKERIFNFRRIMRKLKLAKPHNLEKVFYSLQK